MGITEELPTVISFCSGYGGIERGLDLAGVKHRVLAYVEVEAYAIANLVSKMEQGLLAPAPIWTNLKTFPTHLFRDCVDLITGGYPCQPFSAAGKRLGADDPRHLWPYIADAIDTIRPGSVFFENVEGHISMGLREVLSDLEERGYSQAWGIFSAAEVGAPHQRKRVFIMGNSQHNGPFRPKVCGGDEANDSQRSAKESHTPAESEGAGEPHHGAGSRPSQSGGEQLHSGGVRPACDIQGSELADPSSTGWPEYDCEQAGSREGKYPTERQGQAIRCGVDGSELADEEEWRWPARPRQEQHHWEEPRTIEPNVGGASDGASQRVDRLRLLGNGVVPQVAAKAWETLLNA